MGSALNKIQKELSAIASKSDVFRFVISSDAVEKQLRLLDKYPLFFRAARFPETYLCNLGYWGIQCGTGWFSAVESAATVIEKELNKLLQHVSKSRVLVAVDRLLQGACVGHRHDEVAVDESVMSLIPFCSEICEERGVLRITLVNGYLCDGDTWMTIRGAADQAILKASHLCERCGKPGQYRAGYWCRVYCEECAAVNVTVQPKAPRSSPRGDSNSVV